MFKMSTICMAHAWRCFLHWSIAVSLMSCRKLDHSAIEHSFSLSTVFALVDTLLHHSPRHIVDWI